MARVLFVGCSFTANCGFIPENQSRYHWPHLFCQSTGYQQTNLAIGGMSNNEIFLRTAAELATNSYDLVIVMWSQVGRHWVYDSNQNIDDFTIINNGERTGLNADSDYVKHYTKLHYSHFNNAYVNTKHWLLQCLALEKMLKYNNTPYVFIKGFDNYITELNNTSYTDRFSNINKLKPMLDFDNRPDYYIIQKLNVLKQLVVAQDQARWLNLHDLSFFNMTTDVADDKLHPGPDTNRLLANNLINFFKGING